MAVLTLKIKDETFLQYGQYGNPQFAMERSLEKFKALDPGERVLFFSSEELRVLEEFLGRQVETAADLIALMKKVSQVDVEGAKVPLSDGQVKRLLGWSDFYHRSASEILEEKLRGALNEALGGA